MWTFECVCMWTTIPSPPTHQLFQHCTCRALLELLIFLFPPLPGPEDAPQGGQFAVTSDGWSVDPRHQAAGPQHPLLVHQLYYSEREEMEGPEKGRELLQDDEMG